MNAWLTDWLINWLTEYQSIYLFCRTPFPHQKLQKCAKTQVLCTFWLASVLRATAACRFSRSELQKLLRACGALQILTCKCASRHSSLLFLDIGTSKSFPRWGVLYILTCKYASRHSGAQFFDIRTSKIAPRTWCFVHFDLKMRFAPQLRAILPDRNFKNCSEHVVFYTWLEDVLRATAACNFSFLCWTATSAPAALASLLFEHPEPRIIEKTQRFATFPTFGVCIFFLVTLLACWSSFCWLDFSTLPFNCPYCRKLDF